jgi:hypothetical protein
MSYPLFKIMGAGGICQACSGVKHINPHGGSGLARSRREKDMSDYKDGSEHAGLLYVLEIIPMVRWASNIEKPFAT